jgi:hypothetical protein
MYEQVCVPPLGRVPVQSTLTLEPLELEASGLEAPELDPDEDEFELPLVDPWLELEPEVVELPAALLPDVPELDCELPPELAPELELAVAPALVPEFEPLLFPDPGSLVPELHAAESATTVGRKVRRRQRIQDLPIGTADQNSRR